MKVSGAGFKIWTIAVLAIVILAGAGAYLIMKGPGKKNVQETTHFNRAPVASAGPDQTISPGDPVFIDGSRSDDPDGDVLDFFWDMDDSVDLNGDGNFVNDYEYFESNITHNYNIPSSTTVHRVTLNVSDGEKWDTSSMTVTIVAENRTTPTIEMSIRYQVFPGPLVANQYIINIDNISRNGEILSNFSYRLEKVNGSVVLEGKMVDLSNAGPEATVRYLDVTGITYVSERDQITIKDEEPIEEGLIFYLIYIRFDEISGSVELEKTS
jgi:hypothetical protein